MAKGMFLFFALLSFAGAGKIVFAPPPTLANGGIVFALLMAFGVLFVGLFVQSMARARK